jgi:hypothetical protein
MSDDSTDYLWDPTKRPDPEVAKLERALRGFRFDERAPVPLRLTERRRRITVLRVVAAAAAGIVVLAGSALGIWQLSMPAPWSVQTVSGTPRIVRGTGAGGAGGAGNRVAVGGRVETDQRSAARIAVGRVGVADVGPGSRVRVLRDDNGEHRLSLLQGTIHASIWARPRFFVVETPAATAVDLGCVYTLTVDSTGAGILAVSFGEVRLETSGLNALVAAGTAARIYNSGLGLPFPVSAPATFKEAVLQADSGALSDSVLDVLLAQSNVQATITLWHLLEHADVPTRGRIYDRIAVLVPPPAGTTRDATIALESNAVSRWLDVLRPRWNSEPNSPLRRLLVRVGLVKPAMNMAARRTVGRS